MQRLIPALALAVLVPSAALAAKAGGYEPTYTDVASCASEDLGPDEFVRSCDGPGGMGAELHYFDGRILVAFGVRKPDGTLDPSATNVVKHPPAAAASGDPYGPRIEWLSKDGARPCAATVRVRTASGAVLLTGGTVMDSPWAENKGNEGARNAAVAVCEMGTERTEESVAYEEALKEQGSTVEGKALSLCSQCASPALVTLEGAGTRKAVATARLTREDAAAQCRANGFIDTDDAKAVAACAEDAFGHIGGKTYRAEADCVRREITDTSGDRYRYLRMGEDYGGAAPLWRNLRTGEQADVSRAGDSARVTQQFATLCPGAFAYEGFDRFSGN